MRKTCLLGICMILLVGGSAPVATSSYGKVIYSQTVDKMPSGKADVYEKDLDTGKVTVLIPHDAFPKEFKGYVSYLSVSPDGSRLMIGERREPFEGNTVPATNDPSRLWVWKREDKSFRLAFSKLEGYRLGWSVNGRYFAEQTEGSISVYDGESGKTHTIRTPQDWNAEWSSRRESLILTCASEKDGSTVYEQPIDGAKPRVLFRTPGYVSIEQSPDGSGYAVSDGRSLTLVDERGHRLHHTPIRPDMDESMGVDLDYSHADRKLAVLMTYSYGEPRINIVEQLWFVDAGTGRSIRLAAWDGTFPPHWSGEIGRTDHYIEGWSSDDKSILVRGMLNWDSEQGYRSDRWQFWAYAIDGPKGNGRLLFDSGQGCPDITWWRGN